MTITAPSGNGFLSNTATNSSGFKELNDLCAAIENIARKNSLGVPGFSNTEILNYMAALVYTGANNYGNSTLNVGGRPYFANAVWQGNLFIQMVCNTVQTVMAANA